MSTAHPISVALVDDSLPYRRVLSRYLADHGFKILCEASNGRELFVQLDEFGIVPDGCILDTNMPVMAGSTTAKKLSSTYPWMGLIAHSHFDKKTRQMMLDSGASR